MFSLEVNNLSLAIGQKTICRDFNMTCRAGEIWGLLGPNGSGKTTFLHSLAGIHSIQQGEVMLAQRRLSKIPIKELAQLRAILLQNTQDDFPQTVNDFCLSARYPHRQYFNLANKQDYKLIEETLTELELSWARHLPIQSLSGGEKRRLAIASVFIQNPQLFLLDEPTNHLDIRHQMRILKTLTLQAKESRKIILLALHEINLAAQFCTHLILFFPNANLRAGPIRELLTNDNLSELYQYPMQQMQNENHTVWFPHVVPNE